MTWKASRAVPAAVRRGQQGRPGRPGPRPSGRACRWAPWNASSMRRSGRWPTGSVAEAHDLASQLTSRLPADLRPAREEAEAFGVEEFVRRVAQRGDVGPEETRTGTVAVLTTVREAVTPGEFDDVLSQLPPEYRELVGPMA